MIIQTKEKNTEFLEKINSILISSKITEENLNNHKNLIQSLLIVINEKREEIIKMNCKVESAEKELKFWIYDFDNIKENKKIREDISKIQVDILSNNINQELKHKVYIDD